MLKIAQPKVAPNVDVSHFYVTLDPTFEDQTAPHVYCRLQYKTDAGEELTSQEIRFEGESFERFVAAFGSLKEQLLRFCAHEGHFNLEVK